LFSEVGVIKVISAGIANEGD
jgi:hypothetical protein